MSNNFDFEDSIFGNDPFPLDRYVRWQYYTYQDAMNEMRMGFRKGHWVPYIFPQLAGVGISAAEKKYALRSVYEADEFLRHPVLGQRLREITRAVLALYKKPDQIFGSSYAQQFYASMTLFACLSNDGSIFHQVINQYYYGKMDETTLKVMAK